MAPTETLSRCLWFVVEGHARTLGLVIDPERPVEELVADALVSTPASTPASPPTTPAAL